VSDFAIREENGQLIISGVAVPYGERITGTPEYGGLTEEFAEGSFAGFPSTVIIDRHNGVPVSGRIPLRETPAGLTFEGPLLDTPRAQEFAAQVRAGVIGPSIEFAPGDISRSRTGVIHRKVKSIGAIAGTYRAAYSGSFAVRHMEGSNVTDIRETEPEPAPPEPKPEPPTVTIGQGEMAVVAQRITDEAIRSYAARNAFSSSAPVDPFVEFRGMSFGKLAERAMGSGEFDGSQPRREHREWMRLALRTFADTVTTSGANAGMVTPGVVGDVAGIVSRGRPAITAFGGPRAVPSESGMSIDWPYFDGTLSSLVGAQSAEKAEITSAAVNIKKGTEPLATYAGGSDVSYQLLRRSSRPYLDTYFRILLTAWGVVTDAAFVTELESGTVTSDFAEALSGVDATELKNLVIDASLAVETATGTPAEFVLASTTAFTQFAKLLTPITSLANTGLGTTDIRQLEVNVGNLRLIHVPSITAGKLIVSNRSAAAWYEDGPFQAQEEDVAHLGRNVAIWSMGAGARFIPAGIIEMYDVVP
jgi:phage head maturation protease